VKQFVLLIILFAIALIFFEVNVQAGLKEKFNSVKQKASDYGRDKKEDFDKWKDKKEEDLRRMKEKAEEEARRKEEELRRKAEEVKRRAEEEARKREEELRRKAVEAGDKAKKWAEEKKGVYTEKSQEIKEKIQRGVDKAVASGSPLVSRVASNIKDSEKRKEIVARVSNVGNEGSIIGLKHIPVYDPDSAKIVTFDTMMRKMVNELGGEALVGSDLASDPVRTGFLLLVDSNALNTVKIIKDPGSDRWMSIDEAMKSLCSSNENIRFAYNASESLAVAYRAGDSAAVKKNVIELERSLSALNQLNNSDISKPEPEHRTLAHKPTVDLILNENDIISLFQKELNENNENYNPGLKKWKQGKFTDAEGSEAIVSFWDAHQSQANEPSELWLIRSKGDEWEINRKLAEGHGIDFEVIDLQKDGRLEVWVQKSWMSQGYGTKQSELISIDGEKLNILYSNEELDSTGAQEQGQALKEHQVRFEDVDNDGILEIIDSEKTESYAWTGKKFESEYMKLSSKSSTSIYKLQENKYVKVGSEEKHLIGESIGDKLKVAYHKCKQYVIEHYPSYKQSAVGAFNAAAKIFSSAYHAVIGFVVKAYHAVSDFLASKEFIEYRANKGDTLSSIAQSKTGDWRNWRAIMEYNQKHNDKTFDESLVVGERVYIPKKMVAK